MLERFKMNLLSSVLAAVACTRPGQAFGPSPGKPTAVNATTLTLYETARNKVMSGVEYRQLLNLGTPLTVKYEDLEGITWYFTFADGTVVEVYQETWDGYVTIHGIHPPTTTASAAPATATAAGAGLLWACSSDADCSLNGVCNTGNGGCSCDAAWTGNTCSVINFKPAVKGAGLHTVDKGKNTSTWGGSVLRDEATGTYHMWAAEMTRHCGINAWTENSRIVHATCDTATGNFTRQEEVLGVFSHEPNAVRDPDSGEWALFYTAHLPAGSSPAPHPPACNCTDGSTVAGCGGTQNEGATYVSWATSPNGPWTKPLKVIDMGGRQSDTNLAPVLLHGGKLVGIWRVWSGGSWPYLVTAANWKDPASYNFHKTTMLFPELPHAGTEDPAAYLDSKGRFHSLFHNMQPNGNKPGTNLGHAYSIDGLNWTYTGVAGNSSGMYTDGSSFSFLRRERPHPVFAADNTTIVAITNGVAYKDSTTTGNDATYTFLQPVHTI